MKKIKSSLTNSSNDTVGNPPLNPKTLGSGISVHQCKERQMRPLMLLAGLFLSAFNFLTCAAEEVLNPASIVAGISTKDGVLSWHSLRIGMSQTEIERLLRARLSVTPPESGCGDMEASTNYLGVETSLVFEGKEKRSLIGIDIFWSFPKGARGPATLPNDKLKTLASEVKKHNRGLKMAYGRYGSPSADIENGGNASLYGVPGKSNLVILIKDSNIFLGRNYCIDND